jgi:hypothetical protein
LTEQGISVNIGEHIFGVTAMARGRPRKKEDERKTAHLGVRVTPELRDKLAAAHAEAGRTLSQEIEARLRLSFDERQVEEAFGGPTTFWFLRCLARGIGRLEAIDSVAGPIQPTAVRRWWEDQYIFEMCAAFVAEAIQRMRPAGRRLSARVRREAAIDGKYVAIQMMHTLKAVLKGVEDGDAELFAAASSVAWKMHHQTPREVTEDMYDLGLIESRAKAKALMRQYRATHPKPRSRK